MKKSILAISIISLLFIWNISFAYKSDCAAVSWVDLKNWLTEGMKLSFKWSYWNELITEKGLVRAYRNLKKYCCFDTEELKNDKTCKKSDFDDIWKDYPKSQYFLDHIINIMLRRLWPKTYEGLELDEKAAEWEKIVEEFATDTNWALPQKLESKYKEYWLNDKCWEISTRWKVKTQVPKYLISYYDWTSPWTYAGKIEKTENWWTTINDVEKFKKINDWDLTTKYENLCQIWIYQAIKQWRFDDTDQDTITIQKNCLNKIKKILQDKAELYSKFITTETNLLMQNSIRNYNNYLTSRSITVDNTAVRANNYLFWVLRLIQQITLKCN